MRGTVVLVVLVALSASCSGGPQPGTDAEREVLEEATAPLGDPIDKFNYFSAVGWSFAVDSVEGAQDELIVPEGFVFAGPSAPGVAEGGVEAVSSWGNEEKACVIGLFEAVDFSLYEHEVPDSVSDGDRVLIEVHVGC